MRGGDGKRRGKNGREMEKGGESHKKLRLLLSTAGPDITLSYFLFSPRPLHSVFCYLEKGSAVTYSPIRHAA